MPTLPLHQAWAAAHSMHRWRSRVSRALLWLRYPGERAAPRVPAPGEQTIPSVENFLKAAVLVAAMLVSFCAAQFGAEAIEAKVPLPWLATAIKWLWIAVMGVWNCMLLTGMGILAHDAVHRVLFRTPFWNELGGGLLSALAMLPFYANRQFHLTHHSHAHQPGLDPENEMHDHPF